MIACHPYHPQDSVITSYEHSSGVLTEAKGLVQIRALFQNFFGLLTKCDMMTVPVEEVTEDPAQVWLVWDCPDSGVMSATDTFIYERGTFKNIVQVWRLLVT